MKIIQLKDRNKVKVTMEGAKDVYKQLVISKADHSPVYAFRVFTIEPEGHTPFHQHPFEHVNYVIEGEGELVNEQGIPQEFKKGDFALVLADEKHQYRNKSKRDLFIMICAVPKEYE
jgi:quercetin dioxygenase-like cupin family protein